MMTMNNAVNIADAALRYHYPLERVWKQHDAADT